MKTSTGRNSRDSLVRGYSIVRELSVLTLLCTFVLSLVWGANLAAHRMQKKRQQQMVWKRLRDIGAECQRAVPR